MLRPSWKTLMLTTGLAAQLACGGAIPDPTETPEQTKGTALTGPHAVRRLDTAPLLKHVDITALVASGVHSLAGEPTLQANALYSGGGQCQVHHPDERWWLCLHRHHQRAGR